jgi:hypothetical protein
MDPDDLKHRGLLLYNLFMEMVKRINKWWLVPTILLLGIGMYYLPPVHSRLAWRLDSLRAEIKYFLDPPGEDTFEPGGATGLTIETAIVTTRAEYLLTLTPLHTSTPDPALKPTITSTPLPGMVMVEGVIYEHQHGHLNYCGPANFSMALRFWGWEGNREVIGSALQPNEKDKNVMPYELQDFISENVPGIRSVARMGGNIELLKRFVAAGFPVVVEKGIYEIDINGRYGWMGHYAFVTGYDEANQMIIYQDSYQPEGAPPGPDRRMGYEEFLEGWRSFNYIFVVVYPVENEADVFDLLGDLRDEAAANRHALQVAKMESKTLPGIDGYFAWFNIGTSHVALHEYVAAAIAYDQAFAAYAALPNDNTARPYRMLWYQTGPYFSYYYSNRFADVIDLASLTLNERVEPDLEESLLWRGRAYYMAGKTDQAVADYRTALKIHPNWSPALEALAELGLQP